MISNDLCKRRFSPFKSFCGIPRLRKMLQARVVTYLTHKALGIEGPRAESLETSEQDSPSRRMAITRAWLIKMMQLVKIPCKRPFGPILSTIEESSCHLRSRLGFPPFSPCFISKWERVRGVNSVTWWFNCLLHHNSLIVISPWGLCCLTPSPTKTHLSGTYPVSGHFFSDPGLANCSVMMRFWF